MPTRPISSDADIAAEFTELRCTAWNLDNYYARLAILRALRRELTNFRGSVLDVGCGRSPYKPILLSPGSAVTTYIGMDLENNSYVVDPDLKWNGQTIPLEDNSVQSAIATEVLEHCADPTRLLREVNRVMSPGGFIFVTVPFLWPLHDNPYDEYRYTPFSLERHFRDGGFQEIRLTALGGWDAALATMLGLWVRRRSMGSLRRRVLQRLLLPVYRRLIDLDSPPTDFGRSCMITGLAATARK
jgi:SAM-dependent methyltransferase